MEVWLLNARFTEGPVLGVGGFTAGHLAVTRTPHAMSRPGRSPARVFPAGIRT